MTTAAADTSIDTKLSFSPGHTRSTTAAGDARQRLTGYDDARCTSCAIHAHDSNLRCKDGAPISIATSSSSTCCKLEDSPGKCLGAPAFITFSRQVPPSPAAAADCSDRHSRWSSSPAEQNTSGAVSIALKGSTLLRNGGSIDWPLQRSTLGQDVMPGRSSKILCSEVSYRDILHPPPWGSNLVPVV